MELGKIQTLLHFGVFTAGKLIAEHAKGVSLVKVGLVAAGTLTAAAGSSILLNKLFVKIISNKKREIQLSNNINDSQIENDQLSTLIGSGYGKNGSEIKIYQRQDDQFKVEIIFNNFSECHICSKEELSKQLEKQGELYELSFDGKFANSPEDAHQKEDAHKKQESKERIEILKALFENGWNH